jgi:hypothetical protein
MTTEINGNDPRDEHIECRCTHEDCRLRSRKMTARRCNGDPCTFKEQCDVCLRELGHDYVHWNGAFNQCEECARLESLHSDRPGLDPIFGGHSSRGLRRMLIEVGALRDQSRDDDEIDSGLFGPAVDEAEAFRQDQERLL